MDSKRKSFVKAHFDYKKRVFDLVYLALVSALAAVALGTGFVSLPPVVMATAIAAGLLIFLRAVFDKGVPLYLWIAYMVAVAGTFLLFVIRGADDFEKRLWWNLVLAAGPSLTAAAIWFADKITLQRFRKIFIWVTALLMTGTATVYLFFMYLRVAPTVESLKKGHDEYLDGVAAARAGADSPNVLVILMDDMAYSDVSLYSYRGGENATINTPNIDSIADGGIVMDNFYSSSPVCSPSRFGILTGRYSSRGYLDNVVFPTTVESDPYSITHFVNPYQFLYNVDGILGDEITFAEVLQAKGYRTACIGKWNLGDYGEYLPTNQGFDLFYGSYYVNDMTPYNWVRDTGGNHPEGVTHAEVRTHSENLDQSESTRLLTEQTVDFIENSVDSGEKFLAYYATPWPHWPVYSDNNGNGKGDTSDDTYIDCIEEFDKYLGDILGVLKEKGVYDDTLIIFTSDNGPGREGVTGALRGRKNTTFDGGMKVPLIASYPAGGLGSGEAVPDTAYDYYEWVKDGNGDYTGETVKRGGVTKHITSASMNFDLFTTILDYCGVSELPSDRIIDGVSLKGLWSGNVAADSEIHDVLVYLKGGKAQAVRMTCTVDGERYDFKYYDKVRTENSAFINQFYKNYLFNLDLDPAEGYDVSKRYPEIAAALNAELVGFRREMRENRRGIIEKE